ncbi:response regulator [candidate division KSB1 bacterium]|nr:response regulator [candidate division KSB1 bacterium]
MSKQTIIVADSDPKNLQILKENLEAASYRVITVADGVQAWEKIAQNLPTLVLSELLLPGIDGLQLLERLQKNESTSKIPLIFLTNKRELQDRVRSLKMGAKDYLVKPLHVKEVIAHIKMVLGRLERRKAEDNGNSFFKIEGSLEELNLFDLIEGFGVERKTGVLTVETRSNKSGMIFFNNGSVINAKQGLFQREKAVYQMLPWKNGSFKMVFKDVEAEDEISVSNLGLLLQGLRRMEQREKYMKQLPSPSVKLIPTPIFKKVLSRKKPTKDLIQFVALFDGKRDVLEIIDESCYDDLKTLERIIRLYGQGFIKPVKAVPPIDAKKRIQEPESPPIETTEPEDEEEQQPEFEPISAPLEIDKAQFEPSLEDTRHFQAEKPEKTEPELPAIKQPRIPDDIIDTRELILPKAPPLVEIDEEQTRPEESKKPKSFKGISILIGDDVLGENSLFNIIFDENFRVRHFTNHGIGEVKYGRIAVDNHTELMIISIPLGGQFNRVLEHFSQDLLNYALVVDCAQSERCDYYGYLARALNEKYEAPFFIIATNLKQSEIRSVDVLMDRMQLDAKVPVLTCDELKKEKILNIITKSIDGISEESRQTTKAHSLYVVES